jgi:6-phosphogluconolactonase (cycloisomerase 2 family)
MSFLRAARAALAGETVFRRILVALTVVVVVLAGFSLSCGSSTPPPAANHSAYVTLPSRGNVLLLDIDSSNGVITLGAATPSTEGTTPTGVALSPSRKFLYAVNSYQDTISTFDVHSDGTLTLTGASTPAGPSPNVAVIDPSGNYLLVTNSSNSNGSISVFSIDSGSGALTQVQGSPFPANAGPNEIRFTHSGAFAYVSNPGIGMVTGFSFANGVLTPIPGSPFSSGSTGGAFGLAVDPSDRFLYVANPSATNLAPFQATVGNISGFNIDSATGALSPIQGSPFTSTNGAGPTQLAVDPGGRFLYAVTPGSSSSIWCFTITSTNGQLVEATGSPFSVAAGSLFALFDPVGNNFYIGSQTPPGIQAYSYDSLTGALKQISGSPFSTLAAPGKMVLSE